MSPEPEVTAPGTLTDVFGEPFYIALTPCIAKPKKDGKDTLPMVVIMLNGSENTIPANHAWKTGLALIKTSYHIGDLEKSGRLPGELSAGVTFSCGDSPVVQIGAGEAEEIGMNLMGAAVSALHDMTIWNHLTGTLGWTQEKATKLFDGIEEIDVLDYLG